MAPNSSAGYLQHGMWRMKLQSHKLVHAFLLTDMQPPILDTMLDTGTLDTGQLDSYLDDKAHWLDEHKVKSLVPTFAFTPSTQLLHVPTYHKARMALVYFQSSHGPSIFSKLAWPLYIFKAHMALVYFQSSHGPHKIQSDKELDIQVWLTPPSFSWLLPADCLNTRFLGVPRLCDVSDHPLYIFVYLCVNYTLWRLGASIVGANCRFFRYSPLKLITLQSRIISIIGIYLKRPFLFFCRVSATISSITLYRRLPSLSPVSATYHRKGWLIACQEDKSWLDETRR